MDLFYNASAVETGGKLGRMQDTASTKWKKRRYLTMKLCPMEGHESNS